MEIWVWIKGYKGYYKVSNFGRIISYCKKKDTGKVIKPWKARGYYYIELCLNKKGKTFLVSRLVAQAFIPNPEGKPQVNHKDDDPFNNYAINLVWGTCAENMAQCINNHRHNKPKGEDHWKSKLSWKKVREIRDHYNNHDYSLRQLAKIYKVTSSNIWLITTNKIWATAACPSE